MIIVYACDIECVSVCEFRGRNSFKRGGGGGGGGGENVKPEKNSIFLKNGKTVICFYSTGKKYGNFLDL